MTFSQPDLDVTSSFDFPDFAGELRDQPVFICGHPKAGTSLLRAVLDSHPQLLVYPEESVFFRRLLPILEGKDLDAQLALAEQALIHIFNWNSSQPHASQSGYEDRDYSSISYEQVRDGMRMMARRRFNHPGDLLSAAVLAFGFAAGFLTPQLRYWVEKSPYNEYYADKIFSWWPGARCVHILRDPRDNFASYRRKHPEWNPEFFAANWKRSCEAGMENHRTFGEQRYWFVRYEDLAASPEEFLSSLAEFLQIDWDASLAQPTRAGQQWGGNSMFEDQFQGISAAPLSRWKENLSEVDTATITVMTRRLLKYWTYPLNTDSPPGTRFTALARSLSWPVRRRFYHRHKSGLAFG